MNLVFKNQRDTAPVGAEKMYRDALVSNGTLLLLDFENKGTTFNGDLSQGIYDLARDAAELLGVYTYPEIKTKTTIPALTTDKGLPMLDMGAADNGDYSVGYNFQGITEYLYDHQPECLVTFWLRLDMTRTNLAASRIIRTQDSGTTGNIAIISASASNPTISVRIADKSTLLNYNVGTGYVQVGIEFTGNSTPNKVYLNGEYLQDGIDSAGGFLAPVGAGVLSIGAKNTVANANSPANLYRVLVEDLTVSGRTALAVVQKDYNYVNQLGEFAGKNTRRSYANAS